MTVFLEMCCVSCFRQNMLIIVSAYDSTAANISNINNICIFFHMFSFFYFKCNTVKIQKIVSRIRVFLDEKCCSIVHVSFGVPDAPTSSFWLGKHEHKAELGDAGEKS